MPPTPPFTTASSPARSLVSPLLQAERRLEELDTALDNAPLCAADRNREALEGRFERKLRAM
jgi:hypothetical protein